MKLIELNDVIKGCLSLVNEKNINVIYLGKEGDSEVVICRVVKGAFLINLNKNEIIKNMKTYTKTHISKKFDTLTEASEFVMSQDCYMNLSIADLCSKTGEYGYIVEMDVEVTLSDEEVVKKLLEKVQ